MMKKAMGKRVLAMSVSMGLGLSLLSCGSKSDSSSVGDADGDGLYDGTVNICMSSWIGYGPLYVAKEKGIFQKNGVNVNIQVIESVADINSALASGSSDGSVVATGTYVIGRAAGIKQTQVLVLDDSYGGDGIVSTKDIATFADLKGKKVGVSQDGDTSTLLFYYLLKENNMSADDIELVNLSPADAGAAFVGGKVDAAVTYEPWLTSAMETGKMLVSSEETPGLINDVLCMKDDFIEEYPQTVQAIVDSWFEALEYVDANPDESNQIMAESQSMMLEDFEASLPTVRFFDKATNQEYFSSGEIKDVTQSTADIWAELGLIESSDIQVDSSFDDEFLK